MRVETASLERKEIYDLIRRTILPLPIALISTVGQDGTYNAAPFSFITPISLEPLLLCIAFGPRQGQKKDTVKNIEFSHDFVVNVVDEDLIERTIQTSADYPGGVDEIKETGLTAIASEKIKSPRIAEAKVSLECRLVQKVDLVDGPSLRNVVIAEVVLVHIKDEVLVEGKIDPSRLRAVGNMGKDVYCRTGDIFEMKLP